MYGQGKFAPQFRQGVQMYVPSAQQDRPPYPSTSFKTSTITSQSYMVRQGYSSVTTHSGQPDSTIYSPPFPVPPSGRPNSDHSYLIPPPPLHLNGNTELMQSFPSAQQDPQWTQNVYQIPSHIPQYSPLSPGQASSRGLVWPPFPVGVRGVQPTLQPHPPLSSSMLYAHALGPVAYTDPQVFRTSSALVPSLPSPPPRVPPPLPPSSQLGGPHACVMNHSATLLPSHINQFWYVPSSRPSLLDSMRNTGVSLLNTNSVVVMEDDMTHINEEQVISEKLHEPQMPNLPTRNSLATNLFSSESYLLKEGIKGADHKPKTLPIHTITAQSGCPNTVGEDYFIILKDHGLIRSGSFFHGDAHTPPVLLTLRSPVTRLPSFGGDNRHSDGLHAYLQQPSYHMQDHPTPDRVFVHVDEPADNSPLMSSYKSNSVGGEQSVHVYMHNDERNQSVHVYMHNDERNCTAADVEIIDVKADGRNKKNRRSKSLKHFEAALFKFVKKVLNPFWRQCDMTRVVFKTIVQKSVDKVLGSLKPHHIPNSQVKINRYIELSRSKLTSLVMCHGK